MPAESHIWGPRDYFKGNYYGTTECHFASEIGYHGCPSPKSLEKFIPKESMPKNSIYDICPNPDWLIHAAGIEPVVDGNPYAYRLPLMISQVERLFTKASDDLSTFARQSQVSQAEAVKFFIEMFRCQKWRKTGILWWNVADGWPQVSDAVVDWYGCKKLAQSASLLLDVCRAEESSARPACRKRYASRRIGRIQRDRFDDGRTSGKRQLCAESKRKRGDCAASRKEKRLLSYPLDFHGRQRTKPFHLHHRRRLDVGEL